MCHSLTHSLTDWQRHLLSCPGQLKNQKDYEKHHNTTSKERHHHGINILRKLEKHHKYLHCIILQGEILPLVVGSLLNIVTQFFWGTLRPQWDARNASRTIYRLARCIKAKTIFSGSVLLKSHRPTYKIHSTIYTNIIVIVSAIIIIIMAINILDLMTDNHLRSGLLKTLCLSESTGWKMMIEISSICNIQCLWYKRPSEIEYRLKYLHS